MPWIWRKHGRVFVELFEGDNMALSPPREELTPAERQWLDKLALPGLRRERDEGRRPAGPALHRREEDAVRGGFRFWRDYGRVYVEMALGGGTILTPERRELTPDERRWVDEVAQPELTREWVAFAKWQCSERTKQQRRERRG